MLDMIHHVKIHTGGKESCDDRKKLSLARRDPGQAKLLLLQISTGFLEKES